MKKKRPDLVIRGIEPVRELREVGYRNGLREEDLIDGDALALQFDDGAFDLVCEFGALHHIQFPSRAVEEMLRVSKKAVFIADVNNFGQGSLVSRSLKQLLNLLRLWPIADFVKTKGRGYTMTEDDGLAHSYSVFNNYGQIRSRCKSVHLLNTIDGTINPYRTASHVTLLGIKK
jgi:SAM-dependent methyltransferase